MASLICINLNYVKQSQYVSNDFILQTLLTQTVLTAADFAKTAVTTFDLYCIVLINNQMYVLRERKPHLGIQKSYYFHDNLSRFWMAIIYTFSHILACDQHRLTGMVPNKNKT